MYSGFVSEPTPPVTFINAKVCDDIDEITSSARDVLRSDIHERQRRSVLLREQDKAVINQTGKNGFSQGLCRLSTRYVLHVKSSCGTDEEKRTSSDSCLLGFSSSCNVKALELPPGCRRSQVPCETSESGAVSRHLDRSRLS